MGAPFTFPVAQATPFDGSDAIPPFTAENVKDGIIEARETAQGKARVTIPCLHNGTVGDGFWIGYSNLIPSDLTPIVMPWNAELKEVSFANNRTSVDGNMNFFINGQAVGDIVYTENFSNVDRVKVFTPEFNVIAGDLLRMQWDDTGQNPRDMALMLFFTLTD
jgi:hypothetical protein